MVALGQLHLVILAPQASPVIEEHGAVVDIAADPLRQAEREAHVKRSRERPEPGDGFAAHGQRHAVHFFRWNLAVDDFIYHVSFQHALRRDGQFGASGRGLPEHLFQPVRVSFEVQFNGFERDRRHVHISEHDLSPG